MDGSGSGGGPARNVRGRPLVPCSHAPLTGFYRDGCCHTSAEDLGRHVVCAVMTEAFLEFSRQLGNDLITPRPEYRFPGLRPGDRWCVCAARWYEAYRAGRAPPVLLAATHEAALDLIPYSALVQHALDPEPDHD